MLSRVLPVAALFAACVSITTLAQQQQQRFRAGIELISLNVSVSEAGKFVTDLEQEEFEVFEDGVKQNVSFFSRKQQPIALAILLDTSNSMEDKLVTAQQAAIGFAKRLRAEDVAEVIGFSTQVRILQPFTSEPAAVERAIRETNADGSTALYNAIYISLKELKKVKATSTADIRRQAIVLLSDGDDTSSLIEFEEVLDLAKRSETAIYAIGLRAGEVARREFKEAEFVLKQLANETGGRAYFVTDARELPKIYQTIWDELSSQYAVAYSSGNPKRDGAWRRIQVRLLRPNTSARTKQGYYGPTGS